MANSLWIDAVRSGLASAKPTVPDVPPDTFVFYYETDTELLKMWDGSAWVAAAASVGSTEEGAGEDGVTASYSALAVSKYTLTLDAIEVAVSDANDYGSAALFTFPDRNLIVLGCEVDLELVKDGTGFIDTTDLDVALGTAAASNTTLSSGMVNVLPKQDLNATDLSPALAAHSLVATPALLGITDAANNVLYLNISGPTETSEDATVTASGTVELYVVDLGNTTS